MLNTKVVGNENGAYYGDFDVELEVDFYVWGLSQGQVVCVFNFEQKLWPTNQDPFYLIKHMRI